MSVLFWIAMGLIAGACASQFNRDQRSRVTLDIAFGLVGSLVGGILFIFLT